MGETAAHLTHKALTGIDIAIIAVYFVVIFAIGFYFARKELFVAMKEFGWVTTSSPGPTPSALSARTSAPVPVFVPTACLAPT